jgi:hypothetical protein
MQRCSQWNQADVAEFHSLMGILLYGPEKQHNKDTVHAMEAFASPTS